MTCRLPQTPRTPTAAADHYFDDILFSSGPRPKKPSTLRRSSTTRSIGFRSDYENSINGDDEDPVSPVRRKNSVGYLYEDEIKAKKEIQDKFNDYVDNATHSGYGCAINGNIAAMVADPEHLLHGSTGTGETVVMSSNKAIETFREAKPSGSAGLPAVSSQSGGGN